jgi:hypothetical protein
MFVHAAISKRVIDDAAPPFTEIEAPPFDPNLNCVLYVVELVVFGESSHVIGVGLNIFIPEPP